jgi:hypothetical protein
MEAYMSTCLDHSTKFYALKVKYVTFFAFFMQPRKIFAAKKKYLA